MIREEWPVLVLASIAGCAAPPCAELPAHAPPTEPVAPAVEEPRQPVPTRAPGDRMPAALDWLAARQSPDGGWDGDVGTTGLALLAFLGTGETHQTGTYREAGTVKRAWQFLRERQDADGCVGPRGAPDFLLNHALAAVALCESYGLTSSPPLEEPSRRSVAFALTTRTPGGGWHRKAAEGGGLDVATTEWMVMLLNSAGMCELSSHDAEIAEAVAELSRLVDPTTGRVGGETGGRDTAIVLLSRILAGQTPKTHPDLRTMADAVLAEPPACGTAADVERTYFGNLGMYQFGGVRWRRWCEPMIEAVFAAQRCAPGDSADGSWDVSGTGFAAGPVRATALCSMTLHVFYRIGDMENWRREKWNE